jgi:hypothetical protein
MYEGLSDDVLEILAGCPELAAAAQEAHADAQEGQQ